MKRNFMQSKIVNTFVLFLFALFFSATAWGQSTLTVYGDNTTTNEYVPIYGYYADEISLSQFIIPSSDLSGMASGSIISKLTFYSSNENVSWGNAKFEVYMTEVNYTVFSSANMTWVGKVKNANSLQINNYQMIVELDDPYIYMGGNLLIGVKETSSGSWESAYWYGVNKNAYTAIGNEEYSGSSYEQKQFLPKTTFTYTPPTGPYLTLAPSSATVLTGFTQSLTASYGNVSGTPSITYTSSNTNVATVSGSGTSATVTAVAPGSATITATMTYQGNNYTSTCAITVEDPSYCEPSFSNPSDDYISKFATSGGTTNINNTSTYVSSGYSDYYNNNSVSIEAGATLTCTVTSSSTQWSYGHAIWVDWNKDYEFTSEERVAYTSSTATGNWTGSFVVPANIAAGDYRMRVIHLYNDTPTDPCMSGSYGEAEDYKLTVVSGASSCTKTIAYTYGFEDDGDMTCWTQTDCEWVDGYYYDSNSPLGHSGSNGLFIISSYNGNTEPQYLISPELSGIVNGLHVEFYYANVNSAPETFYVGYSTTNNNVSSFSWGSVNTNTSLDYTRFSVNYPANTKYVAVKYTTADSYYLLLDDFTFEEAASCLEPTNIAASNISTTGARISWTAGASETSWDIFYTTNSSTVPTSGTTPNVSGTSSNPYNLTGLDPATTYYLYVRAACSGSDKSDWSLPCTFNTECNAMSLPYSNNFESGTLTVCWTAINESPIYMSTSVSGYSPNNGTYHLELDRRTPTGTQIIVLPEVDASYALTGYEVSFYAMLSDKGNGNYTTANRTLTIGVMTDPTDPSTFVQVGEIVSPTDTYAQYTVSLSGYSGNGHYIAIKHDETTSGNNGYTFIDDLKVSTPPPTKIVASSTHAADEMTWAEFVGYVNGGHSYLEETVTLMENISVSAMVGNSSRPFRGTFEGNEHKITVSISSSEQGAAPFRYINGATIQNLEVDGTVTSTAHHASGLVGFCADGTNTIRNCLVSTNVTNTNPYSGDSGNNYMGGIIGHNMEATTSIIGCVYNGTLTSEGFKGGMVGFGNYNSNVTITDSYFAGSYSSNGYSDPNFSPISCHGSGRNFNFTFSNFYYNTDAGTFTAPTYEGTVNASYSGTGRAKHGYTITGESPVSVAMNGSPTEYGVSGINAYSTGIVYDGDIIAGDGDNVALTLSGAPAGSFYDADYGTLTGSGSSYTLAMTGNNTKIYVVNCLRPENLGVSANNNSITITWDDNTASEWQVAVHTSDDGNPGNHIVGTVSERTYAVSSLAINQTRYLWVRAYCSASDQSVWIGPVNATTHCTEPTGLTATPFTTGAVLTWDSGTDEEYTVELGTPVFLNVTDAELINESFEGGSMPDGWTSEGDATWSVGSGDYSSSTGSYDGSYNALITHNAYDYETYLVTPAIDLSGATSATLSCYYINRSWGGDIDEFGIYYRINGGSWTELFATSDAHSSWTSTGNISLSTFGANFQLGFKMTDNYGYGVAIDKIVFSVTGNLPTGDYTWTPVTSSATMPYTLTGLTMGNTYYVRVKDQCDNTSDVVAFSPACTSPSDLAVEPSNRSAEVTWLGGDSYNLRYRTAFVGLPEEGFGSAPSGWLFRTGALNNDGTASLSGTSSWSRGTSNNVFDSHIYMNLWSTNDYWLITPSISIQDDCLFNFDVAYTAYSGSNATPVQNCTTHRFAVLISTDNMESWTILREWNNNGSSYSLDGISTTGDNVSISLNSYAGQTAYIAFFAHSETTSYDNNIHFDNVKIGKAPGSWMPSSSGTSASSPYTISNLSSETTYEVQVQATCEGDWNTSATFTTLPEYTVSASVTPAGAGTISGDGIYAEGATCTLIATVEDDCYIFDNWTDNGTPVSANATYSFTVTEDMDLVANFTNRNYTLTIIADEGGTVTGAGDYDCFTPATLTATPDDCHIFRYWKDPNNVTYNMNPLTPLGVDHDITFIAHFELRPALSASIANATDYCRNISATALSTSPTGGSESYSYQWQSSADNSVWSSTGTNSNECSISTASVGSTYYRVIVTDTHGCGTATAESVQITVNDKPSVSFTQPAAVCSGAILTLSASVTDNGGLSTTDGYTISEDQSSWTAFTNGSTVTDDKDNYYIKYTATNGCGDNEIIRQITVHSLPTASIEGTNPLPVCVFTQVTLNASGAGDGGSYEWDNELGSGASKTITVTEAKNYTVTVTDANTCTARATKSVTIKIPGNLPSTYSPEPGIIWTGYESTDWDDQRNWLFFNGDNYTPIVEDLDSTLSVVLRTGGTEQCILHDPVINNPEFDANAGMTVRRNITVANGTELNIGGALTLEGGTLTLGGSTYLAVGDTVLIANGATVSFSASDTLVVSGNFTLSGNINFVDQGMTDNEESVDDPTDALVIGGDLIINGASTFSPAGGSIVFARNSGNRRVRNNTGRPLEFFKVELDDERTRSGVPHTVFPDGTIIKYTAIFSYGIWDGDLIFAKTGNALVKGGFESYASGNITKIGKNKSFSFPTGGNDVLGSIAAKIPTDVQVSAKFNSKTGGYDQEHDGYPRWWNNNDMCDGSKDLDHVSNYEYWTVRANTTTTLTDLTFTAEAADRSSHFNPASSEDEAVNEEAIRLAMYNGCWKNLGGADNVIVDDGKIEIEIPALSLVASGAKGIADDPIITLGSTTKTTILPIELTSFTATCDGRSSLIEWTTATERNNDYFSLERSDDAINFTEIARVAGAGNSIEPLDYSYTDYVIHGGNNYYRLVQVDYDGTRTVSEIVVANCVESAIDGEPEVMAYPNPFNGELTLVLDNFSNRAATIEVYDMLGKLIYTEKASAPQNSYETVLNLSNLPSGAYTVRVSTTDFVINKNVVKN